ncbi:rhomboid family intramembrane serine protease GlpG [Pantoea alhagi]|uniref:Rhomboid protease GlpG n=1 Tax=Pantoea alhagi TaxID=1891675 RepID=A0A1W6BAV1_9GAMM|nr:rhomboid family intramembrane serine protease GlpG [Pantoea alhagi]ARJ44210.1 rhomboid family intramembrane serine protease GlpG [Pantoea alhagi]
MQLTQFNNPRMAQAFVDYMATRGVTLHIKKEDQLILLLEDETKQQMVENELEQFVRDPFHPRYQAASWQSGTTDSKLHYQRDSLLTNLRQRAGPLTILLAIACIAVYILMLLVGDFTMLGWLAWRLDASPFFQPWRWFSHILLHFSLLHLVFNLLWWWYIGGAVEKRLGSGKLFVITLISALLSGWMQAKFSGPWFGGLSGVVYALMGYAWLRGERDPESGIFLERGLMAFAILWLVIGYFGAFGLPIANTAHATGLAVGLAMAFVDTRRVRKG